MKRVSTPVARTKVFISYSHKDVRFLNALLEHLAVFQQRGPLALWVDTQIEPGDLWLEEIRRGLAEAKVAILLVSASFLISKFITTEEVPTLLKAAQAEGVKMLPVIVRPCAYQETELAPYQSVNGLEWPARGDGCHPKGAFMAEGSTSGTGRPQSISYPYKRFCCH